MRNYCHNNLKAYPITFLLGFYVSLIIKRWWAQYELLPWPGVLWHAVVYAIRMVCAIHILPKYVFYLTPGINQFLHPSSGSATSLF